MGWNGNGTFARLYSWVQDAANGLKISPTRMDADTNDIVTSGLGNCITRDNQGQATAQISFPFGIAISNGTVGTPAINFTSDTNNGIYYTGTDAWAAAAGGANAIFISKIDSTGNVGIGANATPITNYSLVVSGPTSAARITNGSSGSVTADIWNQGTSGDNLLVNFMTEGGSGTVRGSIDYNRAGGAVRYNTTSSQELKTAIVDIPAKKHDQLAAVADDVQLREFEWIDNPGVKTFGIVTEELAAIYPDAVSGDGKQYDRSMLVFPLLAKCKALEDRLAALEAK